MSLKLNYAEKFYEYFTNCAEVYIPVQFMLTYRNMYMISKSTQSKIRQFVFQYAFSLQEIVWVVNMVSQMAHMKDVGEHVVTISWTD